MTKSLTKQPEMQPHAEAVVENPNLPLMEEAAKRPTRSKGALRLMKEEPPPDKGGKNRMPEAKKAAAKGKKVEDQISDERPKTRGARTAKAEGYLRMRVRVADGELSVLDIHEAP